METTNVNLLIGYLTPILFIVLYTLCFIPESNGSNKNKRTSTLSPYRFFEIPVAIPIFKKGYRRGPENKKFSKTDVKNLEKYLLLPKFRLRFYEDKFVLFSFLDEGNKHVGMARYNHIDLEAFLELNGDKTDIFTVSDSDFESYANRYYLLPLIATSNDNKSGPDYRTIMSNDIEDLIIYSLFFYRNAAFIVSREKELPPPYNIQDNVVRYYIKRLATNKAWRYFNWDNSNSYNKKFLVTSQDMENIFSIYSWKISGDEKTREGINIDNKKSLACLCDYYRVKWVETEPIEIKGRYNHNGNKAA